MLTSGLKSDITVGLDLALHDIFRQEISDFFSKEYFLLNIDGVSEIFALLDFVSGLDSEFVKHLIVTNKGAHHSFEESAIEHKSRFVNEVGHFNYQCQFIINSLNYKNQFNTV